MPTATEYRTWSAELESLSVSLVQQASSLVGRWANDPVCGGRLATALGGAVDACEANTWSLARRLSFLARECSERAAVCDAFTSEYQAWTRRLDDWARSDPEHRRPLPPREPMPRAAWVERG